MTLCQPCADAGRAGSCARKRCYCGHPECWAFDSWVPLKPRTRPGPTPTNTAAIRASWDEREADTWLDKL